VIGPFNFGVLAHDQHFSWSAFATLSETAAETLETPETTKPVPELRCSFS
jgi:hypothetical protein